MTSKGPYALIPAGLASEIITAHRLLKASGLIHPGYIEKILYSMPRIVEEPIHFRNDSGEEIPRYACMQVTGTVETDDRNLLLVDLPADTDMSSGAYLFNGHHAVAIGDTGTAQKGRHARAIMDSGSAVAGVRWQPVVGDWTIEENASGPFLMAGADELIDMGCKIFLDTTCC